MSNHLLPSSFFLEFCKIADCPFFLYIIYIFQTKNIYRKKEKRRNFAKLQIAKFQESYRYYIYFPNKKIYTERRKGEEI
jgi:hypothetical protein